MPESMDEFLKSRQQRIERDSVDLSLRDFARCKTSGMFAALVDAVNGKFEQYRQASGTTVRLERDDMRNGGSSKFTHNTYPTFFLELKPVEHQPVIRVRQNIKQTATATDERSEFDIDVLANARGECHFKIAGEVVTAETAADLIVVPVLKKIDV